MDFINNRNEICGQESKFSKCLNIGLGKYIYVVAVKVVETLFHILRALLRICPILNFSFIFELEVCRIESGFINVRTSNES